MSFKITELCFLLVEENYGELPARVFATLMKHGRLRLPVITQHSELSPRQVQHGLAMLIQQNLIFWSLDLQSDLAFYEADWYGAYSLVRWGKAVKAVESRHGGAVGSLYGDCLLSGHFNVGDFEKVPRIQQDEGASSLVNGHALMSSKHLVNGQSRASHVSKPDIGVLHSGIYTLLEDRLLTLAHEAHFRPETENNALAEEAAREQPEFSDKIKKKDLPLFKASVQGILQSWLQGSATTKASIKNRTLHTTEQGSKRQFEEDSGDEEQGYPLPKKRRLENGIGKTNGIPTGNKRQQSYIDADIALRVNVNKIAVVARSEKLLQLVEERLGPVTAMVYAAVLKKLDEDIYQCWDSKRDAEANQLKDDKNLPCVSTFEIFQCIQSLEELKDSIGKVDASKTVHDQPQHRKEHRRKVKEVELESEAAASTDGKQDGDGDSWEHNVAFQLTRQHLLLLVESPFPFLRHQPDGKIQQETWSIPFRALAERMQLVELSKYIASHFGPEANRIVRLLQEVGKLDERTIGHRALVPSSVTRKVLQTLAKSGFIEIQEVPRDTNRQPSRAIWLWFFDVDQCGKKILEDTYQTMSRCLQRLKVEREAVKDVLNNAARTDVVGKEDEMLSAKDLADLKTWRSKEEMLLGELNRLDDIVLVLRDFQGF